MPDRLAGECAVDHEPAIRGERSEDGGPGLAADRIDGVADALLADDAPHLLVDRAVLAGDHGVAAQLLELVDGLPAADDVERLEAVVPPQLDHHPAQGRAGGRLEQPFPPADLEHVPRHRQHGRRVDE